MKINIHLDDSLKVMESMPDKKYGLAIVDPPYGLGFDSEKIETNGKTEFGWNRKLSGYKNKDWDNKIPPPEYFEEVKRVSTNQIIWGGNYFGLIGGYIFWDKLIPEKFTLSCGELAYVSNQNSVKKFTYRWAGFLKGANGNVREDRTHPTQKPIALYKWLLKNYGFNKDGSKRTIFDSHFGSLSIGIACVDMGFDLDAWEIDEDYFNAAALRLYNHVKQLDLFREPIEINCNGIPIKEYVEKIDRHVKSI